MAPRRGGDSGLAPLSVRVSLSEGLMEEKPKRPRGRPPLPDDQKGVPVSIWMRPAAYDAILHRASVEGESVSSMLRRDLELVAAWRQRKRTGEPG